MSHWIYITYGSNSQQIKYCATVFPSINISVLGHTLIIKSIYLSNLSALVVTSQKSDFIWIFGFKSEQSCKCFQTVVTPVNKIAEEHIVRIRDLPTFPEQLFQIVELKIQQNRTKSFFVTGLVDLTCPCISPQTVTGVETG